MLYGYCAPASILVALILRKDQVLKIMEFDLQVTFRNWTQLESFVCHKKIIICSTKWRMQSLFAGKSRGSKTQQQLAPILQDLM